MPDLLDVQTFVAGHLNSRIFLEEFTFSRNKFTPPTGSQLELADAVVMLGDVLLIYQIKERELNQTGDEESERQWFRSKVLGKATKQIRDTLGYLQSYDKIEVPNERGRLFNLAEKQFREIIKIIIYKPSPNLPKDCRLQKHHFSRSGGGFIHLVAAQDYWELAKLLQIPHEIIRYFEHREALINAFPNQCSEIYEPSIAGHFIGSNLHVPPTQDDKRTLGKIVDEDDKWNFMPLLRTMHDHVVFHEHGEHQYEDILLEFAKMPRSVWYHIKERINLCIEKAADDKPALPYRLVAPESGCGVVFIPVMPSLTAKPEWPEIRLRGLENFTRAHKYEQKLDRCIGVQFAKMGKGVDILWMLLSHEWYEEPEIQAALDADYPFRKVKQITTFGYHTISDDQ